MLLPLVSTPVAIGIAWNLFYDPTIGLANFVLTRLGLPKQAWDGFIVNRNSLACSCGYMAVDPHDRAHSALRARQSFQ